MASPPFTSSLPRRFDGATKAVEPTKEADEEETIVTRPSYFDREERERRGGRVRRESVADIEQIKRHVRSVRNAQNYGYACGC
jgi:hypothetical protein